eukprot:232814-Amphidinium_carterae.1
MAIVLEVDVDPFVLNPFSTWRHEQGFDGLAEDVVAKIGQLVLDGWMLSNLYDAVQVHTDVA